MTKCVATIKSLVSPVTFFREKLEIKNETEPVLIVVNCLLPDIEYKRLGTERGGCTSRVVKSTSMKSRRGLWFIPSAIRHTKTLESIKSKVTKGKDLKDKNFKKFTLYFLTTHLTAIMSCQIYNPVT